MPAQDISLPIESGTFIHVYNKGVDGRHIFSAKEDYEMLTDYLRDYLSEPNDLESKKKEFTVKGRTFKGTPHLTKNYFGKIELIAYTLSPNHFHLILREVEKGYIERFVRSLSTRYVMYFNKKYNRGGALFEGSYKSAQINNTKELTLLVNYVHKSHENNGYSSLPEFTGARSSAWIFPHYVLNSLNTSDYANLVMNSNSTEEEAKTLELLVIEKKEQIEISSPEQHRNLTSSRSHPVSTKKEAQAWRIPEYLIIAGIFTLLFDLGLYNVQNNLVLAHKEESPKVLSAIETPAPFTLKEETKVSAEKDDLVNKESEPLIAVASPSGAAKSNNEAVSEKVTIATQSATPAVVGKIVVNIRDGSTFVNIRSSASINSDTIAQAKHGEIFEYISRTAGWYEIVIDEVTTGFITPKYVSLTK